MERGRLNRRDLLKGIATGVGAGALATAVPDEALAQAPAVRVRQNLATAPAVIPDSTLSAPQARRVLKLASYWGGRYSTATGEQVTVYVSDSYPQDQAIPQRWADFLDSLVHGPELSQVTVYLAPLDEVQTTCGPEALACYSPAQSLIVTPGDPPAAESARRGARTFRGHRVRARN